jgi:hypothetical protein
MALSSIRERLVNLEDQWRFLDWFVLQRFRVTPTLEENDTYLREGKFPDPIPNRPSSLDTLDRKSLLKLWEEDEKFWGEELRKNYNSTSRTAFGRSRGVGSTIFLRTAG